MNWIHLSAPLDDEALGPLRAGDAVLFAGVLYVARDRAHEQAGVAVSMERMVHMLQYQYNKNNFLYGLLQQLRFRLYRPLKVQRYKKPGKSLYD